MSKRKKSRVGAVLLAVILIYFGYLAVNQQKLLNNKDAELKNIQSKIDDITKENEKLKDEHEQIDSDEFIEKTAREKFGYVKSGERVFVDVGK